ncbi:GNAT family N-acetyltransferase [Chelatococcus asaccharovorans]|uniref:Putative acetyltransferase n=1 Tax=Chelatococcus asaccharovorans TaxID=28210 RepID=A0A2V3U4N7_9HYPH|nr:GNAT family N-acetyltransferase [Chelatococcus asaccharovorans]MBS7703742.1 GNAT family N-acetyltransferase [Chelatococcus asaccharovorans]PXW57900.1 putative acetyltransferase [Chelatococcus asaccharovorans]
MSDIVIRRPVESDFPAIGEIYADPAVVLQTSQLPFGTANFWGTFYRQRDPNSVELVAEVDGRTVGHLGILTNSSPRRKHVASFGISVHSDYHGKGVGKALVAAMLELTDNWLNIVRLELTVFTDNPSAIALYERFGFEREGVARAASLKLGSYADLLTMARVRLE